MKSKVGILGVDRLNGYDNILSYETNDKIIVMSSVDMEITDGEFLFAKTNFNEINLSGLYTSNMNCMQGMFKDCKAEIIDISQIDTSNVNNMSETFKGCNLTELNLGNIDTSKVKTMLSTFNRIVIDELDLRKFSYDSVEELSEMFRLARINKLYLGSVEMPKALFLATIFGNAHINEVIVDRFSVPKAISAKYMLNWFKGDGQIKEKLNYEKICENASKNSKTLGYNLSI